MSSSWKLKSTAAAATGENFVTGVTFWSLCSLYLISNILWQSGTKILIDMLVYMILWYALRVVFTALSQVTEHQYM